MASSMIHIALAHEINKKLKRAESSLFIGTIAPDIAKLINQDKIKSHFADKDQNIPNLEKFLNKYQKNLNDDFVLGYYIHLYVDYLWFKYFIPEIDNHQMIKTLDGKIIEYDEELLWKYIYNDYTDLNIKLIDYYDLDLKIFYNDLPNLEPIIEEIPISKLSVVVDQMGLIVKNSNLHKDYIIDITQINQFIKISMEIIYSNLIELGVV